MTARRMSPSCARTDELLRAEASGRLPDELAAHAAACATCADALLVGRLLSEDAEIAFSQAEVPAAAVAWWRASLAERRYEERRALRPIAVWEWVSALAVAVLTLVMLPGIKAAVLDWAGSLGSGWTVLGSLSALAGSGTGPLVLAGVAIPALAVVGGLVWAWADA